MTAGAAILIANTRYRSTSIFSSLRTPHDDAENLGDRLRALDFDTYVVHDATRATLTGVIAQFKTVIEALPERVPVFVYFAGHGLQRRGENYLVPVDANGSTHTEVELACVRLSEIMNLLGGRKDQQKLIALDACRTNRIPSATRNGSSGLAGQSPQQYEDVHQTQVLYATEPGHLASDGSEVGSSPFCRGLLEALKTPHVPIPLMAAQVTNFVFEQTREMQTPWSTGNLRHLWPFVRSPDNEGTLVSAPTVAAPTSGGGVRIAPENRYVAERGHLIHKLKAKDATDRWAYYFVLVPPENEAAFMSAIHSGTGTIDLERFGRVVASCYGETPSDEIRYYLKGRYGFDV